MTRAQQGSRRKRGRRMAIFVWLISLFLGLGEMLLVNEMFRELDIGWFIIMTVSNGICVFVIMDRFTRDLGRNVAEQERRE